MSADPTERERARWLQPGRLWSLWHMLEVTASKFLHMSELLRELERDVLEKALVPVDTEFESDVLKLASALAVSAADICADLSLPVSASVADDIARATTPRKLSISISHFRRTYRAELEAVALLVLRPDMSRIYREPAPFGHDVARVFSGASDDLEAAAKCLACRQGTACVFHLMRAMEHCVGVLCGKLSIPNPDRVWGMLLSDMNKAIEAMPKGDQRNQWSEAHANLYHVKQAWRNETMHPKQTYTPDQAEQVFRAMKSFMAHLATLV